MTIIRGTTTLFGLIGDPLSHSLSPLIHNVAIANLEIDAVYVPFAVKSADLAAAVTGLQAVGVRGFNVTIPHKQAVMPYLAQISDLAQAVGAVNTVYRLPSGAWAGTNTDVAGFCEPLQGQVWHGATAVILGTGGAARATIVGCQQLGLRVIVVGRSEPALAKLMADFGVSTCLWDAKQTVLAQADLCVNTTPIGMKDPDSSPLSLEELTLLPAGAWVYDLVYVPRPTRLLHNARDRDLITVDGLRMLVVQGAAALRLWLDRADIPTEMMLAVAEAAL